VKTVAAVDIRADGVRQNAHRDGAFCHLKAEARRTVADVQTHAAFQGGSDGCTQFAGWGENAVWLAVVAVGDDVARAEQFSDFVEVWRVITNVYHQRQVAVLFLDSFRTFQWRNAILTDHAAAHARFQANDKIRVTFNRLFHRIGVDVSQISQLVLRNQSNAGDVQQSVNLGCRFAGDGVKIVHVIRPGTARIHHGGDTSGNAHAVWSSSW